jgi:hypothetical protein
VPINPAVVKTGKRGLFTLMLPIGGALAGSRVKHGANADARIVTLVLGLVQAAMIGLPNDRRLFLSRLWHFAELAGDPVTPGSGVMRDGLLNYVWRSKLRNE